MTYKNKYFLVALLILFLGFFLLCIAHKINITGVPLGGDWNWPATDRQMHSFYEESYYAWTHRIFLGYQAVTLFPTILLNYLGQLAINLHMPTNVVVFLEVILSFSMAAIGIGLIIRRIYGPQTGSILGLVSAIGSFVLSAIYFDYLTMGWLYAMISVSMLPICLWAFIRGLEDNWLWLLLAGVIFSLSAIQSQAVIWYFLCFIAIALPNLIIQKNNWKVIRSLLVVLLIFIFGNAYWLLPLFLNIPTYIASSDIVSSQVSLGMMGHYQFYNALRGWGSLYNFQFESIQITANLGIFSFFYPFLAIIGLLTTKSIYRWSFGLLILSPVFLYFLGYHRGVLSLLPMANIFRDIPRFSILVLLGSSLLVGLGVSYLVKWADDLWGKNGKNSVGLIIIIGFLFSTYPWWSGEILNWQGMRGADIRLRFKIFPASYYHLEKFLIKQQLLQKAIYYPVGGTVAFHNDPRFRGAYKETQDIFAIYSPIAGSFFINDRKFGPTDTIMDNIAYSVPSSNQLSMLSESGVRLFVFRRDLLGPYPTPSQNLIHKMIHSGRWRVWFEDKEIVVYAAKHFKPAVFIIASAQYNNSEPALEFRKINPTLYHVRIHHLNKNKPVELVFNETFDMNWRLLAAKNLNNFRVELPEKIDLTLGDGAASRADIIKFLTMKELTLPELSLVVSRNTVMPGILEFISTKNFGSIQNNNLLSFKASELFKMPSIAAKHRLINGFANGWFIDPNIVCINNMLCVKEPNGDYTLDLAIEFLPQKWFYIGGVITLISTLVLFLVAFVHMVQGLLHKD